MARMVSVVEAVRPAGSPPRGTEAPAIGPVRPVVPVAIGLGEAALVALGPVGSVLPPAIRPAASAAIRWGLMVPPAIQPAMLDVRLPSARPGWSHR